jgi:hypothetical protein
LKELEVKQESYFNWVQIDDWSAVCPADNMAEDMLVLASAFIVAELGELMKGSADSDGIFYCTDGTWQWQTVGTSKHPMGLIGHEPTEADARAAVLIYLMKNNLL